MNKTLVIIGGLLALVGLLVNVAVDLDNVYDMTTTALWALTLILVLAGVFLGGKSSASSGGASTTTQQFRCKTCGTTFSSEAELMEHGKKAHPMTA